MPTRGRFLCHVHCLVHDGAVRSSPCRPHHENFGRNHYHMFVPAYSASQPFVFVLSCGIQVASMSSVDSIPFKRCSHISMGVLILLIIEVVMSTLFQPACFSSSGSDHFNIRKINSKLFLNGVCFIRPQVAFVFPPTPLFLQGFGFLNQVSILFM